MGNLIQSPSFEAIAAGLATLNLFALSLFLRRIRVAVLDEEIPVFLQAAPTAPLALVTDSLLTGVVAGASLVVAGWWLPGALGIGLTATAFVAAGSLRVQLALAGIAGLSGGHNSGVAALGFFDALRSHWRLRRLRTAAIAGIGICLVDLAAAGALLTAFGAFDAVLAIGLMTALRLLSNVLVLPLVAGMAVVEQRERVAEPVGQRNDFVA